MSDFKVKQNIKQRLNIFCLNIFWVSGGRDGRSGMGENNMYVYCHSFLHVNPGQQ